ncbi:MAG: FAD-dependent oxidoreductase [Gammaproteobacteria bacterium]|nr:FAD-dependent oxidoreductase [Gammaproteobacteria bacterium]
MTGAFDAVVLGAGAAGLAAAVELGRHGRSVCVLEARERVGGRILTRTEPGIGAPVELGAEFVHGTPAETLGWLRSAGKAVVDLGGQRWRKHGGELRPADDLFGELKRGLARVPRPEQDMAFGAFLDGPARDSLPEHLREFARTLVEGFDAADASRTSALDTLEEWTAGAGADAPTFRPLGGYASLIDTLTRAIDPTRVSLRLGAVADSVEWRAGAVSVSGTRHGEAFLVEAPQAVVTLPVGVLASAPGSPGAVQFAPPLDAKRRALAGLAMGAAVKVVLRFREPFWETLDGGRYRNGAFFHAAEASFPTLWTSLPLRLPVLTAWAGGPRAARIAAGGEAETVRLALDSVEAVFGGGVRARAALEASYLHDWQSDPFARGAYSYVTVGGAGAQGALAAPLDDTLFFAGEAADAGGQSATVAGALASGRLAAIEVVEADARRHRR